MLKAWSLWENSLYEVHTQIKRTKFNFRQKSFDWAYAYPEKKGIFQKFLLRSFASSFNDILKSYC